jgi:hypothetical protein
MFSLFFLSLQANAEVVFKIPGSMYVYEKYRLRTLSLDGIYFLDSIPLHVSAAFHFSHHQVATK